MQLILHAPFGGRINKAWGLALRKRFCRGFNFELQAAATDNGLNICLAEQHSFPLSDVFHFLTTDTVTELLEQASLASPIFKTRWRWDAGRSLQLLRFQKGKKVPPQIQRTRSDDLLASVFPQAAACFETIEGDIQIPDHPLVQEVMQDVLQEAMDLEGLKAVLAGMHSRTDPLRRRRHDHPLRLRPRAHQRQPLRLPRRCRPRRAPRPRRPAPRRPPRFRPRGSRPPRSRRPSPKSARRSGPTFATSTNCTTFSAPWSSFPPPFWTTPEPATGLFFWPVWNGTDAPPSPASPDGNITSQPNGLNGLALYGPLWNSLWKCAKSAPKSPIPVTFSAKRVRAGYKSSGPPLPPPWLRISASIRLRSGRRWSASNRQEPSSAASLKAPSGPAAIPDIDVEWCERRILQRIHKRTLNALRQQIEPVTPAVYMRFLLDWQHLGERRQLSGEQGLLEALRALEGFEAPAAEWERSLLPQRVAGYDPRWLDALCLTGAVGWGRISPHPAFSDPASGGPRRVVPTSMAPVTFFIREDALWMDLCLSRRQIPETALNACLSDLANRVRSCLSDRGAMFSADLIRLLAAPAEEVHRALWELVAAGLVNADGFDSLRLLIDPRRRRAFSAPGRTKASARHASGRWALLADPQPEAPLSRDPEAATDPGSRPPRRSARVRLPHAPAPLRHRLPRCPRPRNNRPRPGASWSACSAVLRPAAWSAAAALYLDLAASSLPSPKPPKACAPTAPALWLTCRPSPWPPPIL